MSKTLKLYAALFIILLVIWGIFQANKKEITNWGKNFNVKEKTPFGLYVFDHEAQHLLGNQLTKTNENPFHYYRKYTSKKPHNILVVESDIDKSSWEKILEQVKNGSDAMLITEYIPENISDKIEVKFSDYGFYSEKNVLKLTDKNLSNEYLILDKFPSEAKIDFINPKFEILGKTINGSREEQVNFIKTNYGKGHIYIHTEPLFLTNYYLLKSGNNRYAESVFGYLKNQETVWFLDSIQTQSTSPMRVILSKPALRYAWWLFLSGMLLFIIFNAKRKQRIVPIIEPLKNSSVDFVKSIGNLYLQEGDFHDMMAKKAQYFLYKIRLDLLLDTKDLDDEFAKKLQVKTQKSPEMIKELLELIKKAQDPYSNVIREDLIRMNTLINEITKTM